MTTETVSVNDVMDVLQARAKDDRLIAEIIRAAVLEVRAAKLEAQIAATSEAADDAS